MTVTDARAWHPVRAGLRTVADSGTWLLLGYACTHHRVEVHGTAAGVVLVVSGVLTVLDLAIKARLAHYRRIAAALSCQTRETQP